MSIIKAMALIFGAIVLLWLPADFFDQGQTICPSKVFLDVECLGCGMTRAMQHLIHFEFQRAWHFNHLVVVVAPILLYIWLKSLLLALKSLKWKE